MEHLTEANELEHLRAQYLASIAVQDGRSYYSIREWPEEARERGALESAMVLCARLLQPVAGPRESVIGNVFGRLLAIEGPIHWNGLHVTIVGVADKRQLDMSDVVSDLHRLASTTVVICVLPSSFLDEWQDIATPVRSSYRLLIPVFPVDITALADGSLTISDMLNFKLYRSIVLDKLDVECQFDSSIVQEFIASATRVSEPPWRELSQVMSELHDEAHWVDHPRLDTVVQHLRDRNDCLLVGPSSSGKSTLAFEAGQRLRYSGYEVHYIDVGGMPAAVATHAFTWLTASITSQKQMLIIMDDLQSGPSVGKYLLWLLRCMRCSSESPQPSILAMTWPSYQLQAAQELEDARIIHVNAGLVRPLLLAQKPQLTDSTRIKALEELAGDDLVVWRLILDGTNWKLPTLNRADLAEQVWNARIRAYKGGLAAAKVAVFTASVLGRYELELSEGFLVFESATTHDQISALCAARLLRRNGSKIVAGHRSLCTLLADWLARDIGVMEHFARRHPSMQPADLVLAYIRGLDGSEIWPVLRTLYVQVGFRGHEETTQRAAVFVDFWKALDALIERIEHQSSIDPTWGNILSNALFAIEALSGVGKRDQARQSIEFMRGHWRLDGGDFYVLGGTVERLDFDKISEHMWSEDVKLGVGAVPAQQSAGDIDRDRFHQTWVGGLVLCAEAAYRELPRSQLQSLAVAVERLQSAAGYFYPARVPWSTARVLTGLARCGRTYYNSEPVRAACDWLLKPADEGGPRNQEGVWPSGTDGWNSVLETTAMCAQALVAAGIDTQDPRLAPAVRYISEHRSEWVNDGRWLDGAMEVEAYVTMGGSWREVTPEILRLFKEARREAFWGGATLTAKESLKQSCNVGSVADYLTSVVWSSLRTELPEFLETFAVPPLPFPPRPAAATTYSGTGMVTSGSRQFEVALPTEEEDNQPNRDSWIRRAWDWLISGTR